MFKIKLKQQKKPKEENLEKPKIKLNLSKSQPKSLEKPKRIPRIRVKPTRIPGEGYDSEDSEIEDDPLLEEGIVVRLLPDAELDYVRNCVETGNFSNIHMKWRDKRRCVIKINSSLYAAKLIQLPNIVEVQKTVDRKNLFKTFDISQILLVVKKIDSEEEINELQVGDNETFDHGLTPPLHNIMKSQKRKKIDTSYVHSLEVKVDELLQLDEEALDSNYELIEPENVRLEENTFVQTPVAPVVEEEEEEPVIDELELELEQALGEGEMEVDEPEQEEEEESDDDDDDESDNEQGVSRKVEVDENEQHNALLRDEINELKQTIEQNKARLEKTHNPLLQSRFFDSINKLENELENKKRQLKTGEDKKKRDDAVKEAEDQGCQMEEEEQRQEGEEEEEEEEEEDDDEEEEEEEDDDDEEEEEEEEEEEDEEEEEEEDDDDNDEEEEEEGEKEEKEEREEEGVGQEDDLDDLFG